MPEPLTANINDWRATYGHIFADLWNVANHFFYASEQCLAHNWEGLANSFNNLEAHMRNAARHFSHGDPNLQTTMYSAMHWIDTNWADGGEPAEVTMDAILSAMITAEYEQLQAFVGIVDAYRVALWDEWFNVEYYAALARGFKR